MIVLYHQTKTSISFWCRRGLNPRSLIQPSEILLVELTETHSTNCKLRGQSERHIKGKQIWQSTKHGGSRKKKVFGFVGNNIKQLMTKILIGIGNLTYKRKQIWQSTKHGESRKKSFRFCWE